MSKDEDSEMYAYAENIYCVWERLIKSADYSIVIFSPYFDDTLTDLISHAKISPKQITLITELNIPYLLTNFNQLKVIRELIEEEVKVCSIPQLHAKILLVDDKYFTVGSQNFTHRGQENKEVSVEICNSNISFIERIKDWKDEAEIVDLSLIEELEAEIDKLHTEYKKLLENTRNIIGERLRSWRNKKEKEHLEKVRIASSQSHITFENTYVLASVKNFLNYSSNEEYYKLVPDFNDDLTYWIYRENEKRVDFKRLAMYPTINLNTLQMAFSRIGKTHIYQR